MEIRKNFGRYWIAGFIFNLIFLAIQIIGNPISDIVLLNENTIINSPTLLLTFMIGSLLTFIFGFWIYGRIIELLYKKIIRKE
ncbi:hypothetical protein FGU46_07680 [Methanobacterium sp. CWC-01]|uniref:hypothetical protein n=1 Tax=Methanobacterium aridiramus TaxID=2584467 RepID=UPI0025761D3D|nr:hypothetical protein [Methanobacterium sp. CWC-01]WJI09976.1 hypothetical protein FGU46_07680 [Methanobacterium sp. CWC-01]